MIMVLVALALALLTILVVVAMFRIDALMEEMSELNGWSLKDQVERVDSRLKRVIRFIRRSQPDRMDVN